MKTRGPSAWDARFVRVRSAPPAAPSGPARPSARWLRRAETVLVVIGVALLGEVLLGAANARFQRSRDERTFREAEQSIEAASPWSASATPAAALPGDGAHGSPLSGRFDGTGSGPPALLPSGRNAPRTTASSGPVVLGRIEIPRVGVSAIVREGDDDATLAVAVGHVAGTARPGEPGNVVLAGHRDSFFRGLRRIRPQDRIWIRAPGHHVEYRVESTEVVGPEETRVLARTAEDTLTLVTCYPFTFVGSAPKRFVVRAAPVVPTSAGAPPPTASLQLEVGDDRKVVAGDPREP